MYVEHFVVCLGQVVDKTSLFALSLCLDENIKSRPLWNLEDVSHCQSRIWLFLTTGEVHPMASAGGRAMHPLKVRVRSAQAEHHVEAQPADTVRRPGTWMGTDIG